MFQKFKITILRIAMVDKWCARMNVEFDSAWLLCGEGKNQFYKGSGNGTLCSGHDGHSHAHEILNWMRFGLNSS